MNVNLKQLLKHCLQTIDNKELINKTVSKGWTLDKFVEEAGKMEDTTLQMKERKSGDYSMKSAYKIQTYRGNNRIFQESKSSKSQQGSTKTNCNYCGFSH